MSGNYTRTMGAQAPARDPTIPRFHMESIEDPVASAAQGRPIFFDQERVQFINPGSTNSPVEVVTDTHRNRWPEEYNRFKSAQEFSPTGTPLEQWPFLKRANVYELKALNIFTVEQCASLSDVACQNIGMGGHAIRSAAAAYLDDATAASVVSEALASQERAEAENAALKHQLSEMRTLTESIQQQLTELRNQAPATERFIQGMHDPIEQAKAVQPMPQATSSLDSLAQRTRPRKVREAADGD